jgi:AcrR family transcriptional regulator|tara:strand:- start:3063 stop:3776 length:714 start_codon:yes stop_codon:yes gene_type:complete
MAKTAANRTFPKDREGPSKGAATRALITETALRLFNEESASDVSTNQIAAEAGISPGNLYYYFRNKEEIIRALFPAIRDGIAEPLTYPKGEPISAERMANDYVSAIEVLWRYRFFFADLIGLGQRDPELAAMIQALQDDTIVTMADMYQDIMDQGDMVAVDQKTKELLALNSFLVWFSWVSFMDRASDPRKMREQRLADGALACLAIIDPYLKPAYRTAVHEALEALMNRRQKKKRR